MAGTYKPLVEQEFRSLMEHQGFHQVSPKDTTELTWERSIPRTHYAVRVYSSIGRKHPTQQAIQVCLVDMSTDRVIRSQRVNRSPDALRHVRERVGDMWRWCLRNQREAA